MDPLLALRICNDTANESRAYRAEVLEGLAEWLRMGGCMPSTEAEMHPTLTEEACESMRSEGLWDLALSVRVALAYGDCSGLGNGDLPQ